MIQAIIYIGGLLQFIFFANQVYKTSHENETTAKCADVWYYAGRPTKLVGEYFYNVYNASGQGQNVNLVYKICRGNKCNISHIKRYIGAGELYYSKHEFVYLPISSLKDGEYTYMVSADMSGFKSWHNEKKCKIKVIR